MMINKPPRAALGLAPTAAVAASALSEATEYAVSRYSAAIEARRTDLAFATVPQERAVSLIRDLRDRFGYAHLVFLTSVDVIEQNVFRLVYMLHDPSSHTDLAVQTEIPRTEASMESIHGLWEQAATYQRELKEMFGIDFPGSPRVDESFVLEGWDEIPPMRREFDTKEYSERTYFPRPGRGTTETRAHMKKNLYPDPAEPGDPDNLGDDGAQTDVRGGK